MNRMTCLLALLITNLAVAAPVPKEKPDPLPDGALVRLGSARFRGFNTDGVSFSKDGKILYATDDANTVFRWDAVKGKPLEPITFDVKAPICSRVRGDRVFVVEHTTPGQGAHNSIVHVFELPSGKSRGKFDPKHCIRFTQTQHGLHEVDISADGRQIAFHSHNDKKKKVYDVSGDDPSEVLSLDIAYQGNVLLSPDGGRLLVTAETSTIVYDVKDGAILLTIPASVRSAAFTPDGSRLIGHPWVLKWEERPGQRSGRWLPGLLTVWDVANGKELAAPKIEGELWQFAHSSTATLFVGRSAKEGPVVERWNLKTGQEEWSVAVPFHVPGSIKMGYESISVSPIPVFAVSLDGTRVAISDRHGRLALLDAASGKRADNDPDSHPAEMKWVELSADGKTAYSATDHDSREWDAATGELKAAYALPDVKRPRFVGATTDLLVWRDWKGLSNTPEELIALDRKTGKVVWRMAPDCKNFSSAWTAGDVVVLRRMGNGEEFFVYDRAGKRRDQCVVKSDSVSGELTGFSADTFFRYDWEKVKPDHYRLVGRPLKTGEPEVECQFPVGEKYHQSRFISPSDDGKYIAVGFQPGAWAVVETATGKVMASGKEIQHGATGGWDSAWESTAISNIRISPCGGKAGMQFWQSSAVRAFELKEKGKAWVFDGKGAAASAVGFAHDGKKAIVGYRDGTALIWDLSK